MHTTLGITPTVTWVSPAPSLGLPTLSTMMLFRGALVPAFGDWARMTQFSGLIIGRFWPVASCVSIPRPAATTMGWASIRRLPTTFGTTATEAFPTATVGGGAFSAADLMAPPNPHAASDRPATVIASAATPLRELNTRLADQRCDLWT